MEISYSIFKWFDKEVHVPSTDYYARNNESQTDSVSTLEHIKSFSTLEEAESEISKINDECTRDAYYEYLKGKYIILPNYIIG